MFMQVIRTVSAGHQAWRKKECDAIQWLFFLCKKHQTHTGTGESFVHVKKLPLQTSISGLLTQRLYLLQKLSDLQVASCGPQVLKSR